jgi:hypothetical protein
MDKDQALRMNQILKELGYDTPKEPEVVPPTPIIQIPHSMGKAKYQSPTKKDKEQPKKKRLMTKASRKANRRKK